MMAHSHGPAHRRNSSDCLTIIFGIITVKVCFNCGIRNDDDAVFCAACNFFLEWSDDAPAIPPRTTALAATPPFTARPARPAPAADQPLPAQPAIAQPAAAQPAIARPPQPLAQEPRPASAGPAERAPLPPPPAANRHPTVPGPAPAVPASPATASPATAPPATAPASPPVEVDELSGEQWLLTRAVDGLERGQQLAVARDRTDLATALERSKAKLDERTIGVAVVGEFKRGKSTLINALLQTAVCPVDADEVTVVPTLVRYGDTPSAIAYLEGDSVDGEPPTEAVAVDRIADFVSEIGNPGNRRGLRSVQVRLPRRMLRTGLCLVDTPGVGGLDSAHGIITLGALDVAQGMLFVTDASQELTEPELGFLRQALARCPVAACVLTKIDLYPKWRQIVTLNEGHLAQAGLDVPVIAVSSFLRLASRRDPALAEESGYQALVEFLARRVIRTANTAAVAAAAGDVEFVADQIEQQIVAEKSVLTRPAEAERVVSRLATAHGRTAGLAAPTATWQQMLSDGVQDLVADVEHDLQGRLRTVLRDVEGIIDAGDPKDAWADIEVWLRRHVVAAAVANFDTLAERTNDLATEVGERFNLDAGGPVQLETGAHPEGLAEVNLASAESLAAPGGRFGSMLMATRTAMFVPMVLFGVAGSLLGAVVAAPLSVVLAAGIGQKIIRDEKKRQVAHRRQQAKLAGRRYVEEVGFIMNKESRDALRRTQRFLRDDFQLRAMTLHRSSTSALNAAKQAMALPEPERRQRVTQLAAESAQLREVDAEVAKLVSAAPAGARSGG